MAVKTRNKRTAAKLYKWGGRSFPVPAQVVGETLDELFPNGHVVTKEVLAEAKNPESPLHACYDWDVEKAAETHWLSETQAIVRSVRVVVQVGEKRERQYAYVHITDSDGPRYVQAERVASDEDIRRAAIEEALTQLEGLKRRYAFIQELAPVFEAAERAAKRIGAK